MVPISEACKASHEMVSVTSPASVWSVYMHSLPQLEDKLLDGKALSVCHCSIPGSSPESSTQWAPNKYLVNE